MTRYEIGFINKCAEYNIDAEKAAILLKNSTLQKQAASPLAKLLVTAGRGIGRASKGIGKKVINGGKAVNNYRKALVDKVTPKSKTGRWVLRRAKNYTVAHPFIEDYFIGPNQETTKGHQDSHNRATAFRYISSAVSPIKTLITHLIHGGIRGTVKATPKINEKYNKLKVRVADLASKQIDKIKNHFNPENQGLKFSRTSDMVVDAIDDTVGRGVEAVGDYLGKKVPVDYKAETAAGEVAEATDRLKINPEFGKQLKQNLEAYKLPSFTYFPWPNLPPYGTDNTGNPNSQKSPTDFLKLLKYK